MPVTARSPIMTTSSEESSSEDWNLELQENFRAFEQIGRRLMAERYVAKKNSGNDLMLIRYEADLIRVISRIYVLNSLHNARQYPPLDQWLSYLNLTSKEQRGVLERVVSMHDYMVMGDKELTDVCDSLCISAESRRRIRRAAYSIGKYIRRWQNGIEPVRIFKDTELAWRSYGDGSVCIEQDDAFELLEQQDSWTSDSGSGLSYQSNIGGSNASQSSLPTCTPPPSPGIILTSPSAVVRCLKPESLPYSRQVSAPVSTSPMIAAKLRQQRTSSNDHSPSPTHSQSTCSPQASRSPQSSQTLKSDGSDAYRLNRSLSEDSSRHKNSQSSNASATSGGKPQATTPRTGERRVNALSPQLPPHSTESQRPGIDQSTMPRSPGAARAMHCIPHKWRRRKVFLSMETCRVCNRQLNFFGGYEKCSSCKIKVHTTCKSKLGDNCGLTVDLLKQAFSHMFSKDNEEDQWKQQTLPKAEFLTTELGFASDSPDNSSSSPGSSTPSTPAYPINQSVRPSFFSQETSYRGKIPEAVPEVPDIVIETEVEQSDSPQRLVSSQGSDSTVRGDGVTGSEGTLLSESYTTSRGSYGDGQGSGFSADVQEDGDDIVRNHILHRSLWSNGTIRVASNWQDVIIAPTQVNIKDNALIGHGRFGDVYVGSYFGEVAIRKPYMNHVDEADRVEAFKQEVALYKNTRHVNIVLFLACCLEKNSLFMVLNLCKGSALHDSIHEKHEQFDFSQVVYLCVQICQGISYLHTKEILHKDLRSKNIFIEKKNRVVITDFGFFSMKRLREPENTGSYLRVPEKWLTYLAPELIRNISRDLRELPFSEQTDMFSFGTIWYELMTYQFPYAQVPNDAIIWRTGKGCTGSLKNVKATREVKEILMRCWATNPSARPSFVELQGMIEKLPKKRLSRSPSYPVSRSHESMKRKHFQFWRLPKNYSATFMDLDASEKDPKSKTSR